MDGRLVTELISHYRLSGVLIAEEPLHIGSGRRTGVIKHSLPYIPGSFIRGAVGSALVKAVCKLDRPLADHEGCPHYDDCAYVRLFEKSHKSSRIFFRYAYPLHLKCGGLYRPAPKTMYKCENSQCGKVFDALIPPDKCDACGGRVKPYRGFICDKCQEEESSPIRLSRFTSTAIDRARGAAAMIPGPKEAAGTLHTLEAIPKGSKFHLEAIIHRDLADDLELLKAVIERGLPDEGMGGSRSRGFGKVSIQDLDIKPVEVEMVERRANRIDVSRFSVQALSPLILSSVLEARTLLEGARRAYSWVFHEGKPILPDVTLEASRLSVEPYSGWSQKEDRPRRIYQAMTAGSIFQFKCEGEAGLLSKALAALEVYPLGDYKPHGCGQLAIGTPR